MKIYIIDTNIILNEVSNLIELSQDNSNTLVIPEVVLSEIDSKKSTEKEIGYQARKFIRSLDEGISTDSQIIHSSNTFIAKSIKINDSLITIHIHIPSSNTIDSEFTSIINDNKIIACATGLIDLAPVIVSNDCALRVRAEAKNIQAQPLLKNRDVNLDSLVCNLTFETVEDIYSYDVGSLDIKNFTNTIFTNEYTGQKILAMYKFGKFRILDEKKLRKLPVTAQNTEQLFFLNQLMDDDIKIVVSSGVAGSGKNLLALTAGIAQIKKYESIKYCRNTITAGDNLAQLGFLKGDESQKLSVFTYPLFDALTNYIECTRTKATKNPVTIKSQDDLIEENNIEVLNINQMRGSNVSGYIILDEWQNSSASVNKLMLTRIKEGSKVVILGDNKQIDHPYLNKYDNALAIMLKQAASQDSIIGGTLLTKVLRGAIVEFAEKYL